MLSKTVVLVTDHIRQSEELIEALRCVSECTVVGSDVDWSEIGSSAAIVTDLDLTSIAAVRCLQALRAQSWTAPPILGVSYRSSDKALRQAASLGLSACLPYYREPHVVVTAVLNLVDPDSGTINATMRQCANRAGAALSKLFASAGSRGRIDLDIIDQSVDPILSALEDGGLARWLNAIQAHDRSTYHHSLTVAGLTAQFAAHIGFPSLQRRRLVRAALVHDLGKSRIPRELLVKRGSLTPEETAIMRTHPLLGYDILRASSDADPAMLDAVRHHHEMLDGTGYPDGQRGDAISDVVRLLTICDVYAALTERRSYKPAMAAKEAMQVLNGMSGKVEPRFVHAFCKAVARSDQPPKKSEVATVPRSISP